MGVTYNTVAEAEHSLHAIQKFDAQGNKTEHCRDCNAVLEPHPTGGAGYVAADSTEVPVQTPTGVVTVAQQRVVCKECSDKSIERVAAEKAKGDTTQAPANPSSAPQE